MTFDATPLPDGALLDRERGRTDCRETLRIRLGTAPPDYLAGALENVNLGPDELLFLLGNRGATGEVLARVARNRGWMRAREVKLGLVAHPAAPFAIARALLPHLFWRELALLAENLRLAPVLRREAEKLVHLRLPELAIGERITLARIASRGLIPVFIDETDAAVLKAVCGNPRATEADLARLLTRADLPTEFLRWLADQSAWAQRRAVRLALVRHARTPLASALRVTQALARRDLEALRHDDAAPRVVRVAAERRLGVKFLAEVSPA